MTLRQALIVIAALALAVPSTAQAQYQCVGR